MKENKKNSPPWMAFNGEQESVTERILCNYSRVHCIVNITLTVSDVIYHFYVRGFERQLILYTLGHWNRGSSPWIDVVIWKVEVLSEHITRSVDEVSCDSLYCFLNVFFFKQKYPPLTADFESRHSSLRFMFIN